MAKKKALRKRFRDRVVDVLVSKEEKEALKQQREAKKKSVTFVEKEKIKRKEVIGTAEKLHEDKYKLKVRRLGGTGGYIGQISGTILGNYENDIEEMLKGQFGGGQYQVEVYYDDSPQSKMTYTIDGVPKQSEMPKIELKSEGGDNFGKIIQIMETLPAVLTALTGMAQNKMDWGSLLSNAAPFLEKFVTNREPTKIDEIAALLNLVQHQQSDSDIFSVIEAVGRLEDRVEDRLSKRHQGQEGDLFKQGLGALIDMLQGKKPTIPQLGGSQQPAADEDYDDEGDEGVDQLAAAVAGIVQTATNPEQAAQGIVNTLPMLDNTMIDAISAFVGQLKPSWSAPIAQSLRQKLNVDLSQPAPTPPPPEPPVEEPPIKPDTPPTERFQERQSAKNVE